MPTFYMMIGIPGSGRLTAAMDIAKDNNAIIHSSDLIKSELFGDKNEDNDIQLVFDELRRRIKRDLMCGKNVICDATNIKKKNRIHFLKNVIVNIDCRKVAVFVSCPYDECIRRNDTRDRKVPHEVIKNMILKFQPPMLCEGFDEIIIIDNYEYDATKYNFVNLFNGQNGKNGLYSYDQGNEHHSLTLGDHMYTSAMLYNEYCDISPNDRDNELSCAILLHDIGKPFARTELNGKGENDGNSHYFRHECAGAYDSFLYTRCIADFNSVKSRIRIANLIYYHMHPYTVWKQSERAKKRDMDLIGSDMFNDVTILHNCDRKAH